MSVYTKVTEAELGDWLKAYSVGSLVELKPIAAGIENTNYFVTTTHGHYVLTLFERLPAKDLPFYLGFMAHLARRGIPCPSPANRTAARSRTRAARAGGARPPRKSCRSSTSPGDAC